MIVKVVIEPGVRHEEEILIDGIGDIRLLLNKERISSYNIWKETGAELMVIEHPDKETDDSIWGPLLLLRKHGGSEILLKSDFTVYIMNDNGKTIQTYYPTYASREPKTGG